MLFACPTQHEREFLLQFFFFLFSFLLTLGPDVPHGLETRVLYGHSLVEIQGDAFVFGGRYLGFDSGWYVNSAIYQLTCSSGICSWSTVNQELKIARYGTVAIPVPDTFCLQEGDITTPSGSGGTTISGGCNQGWIGDGYCDDINNNVGCNFDGGDCCGANVNTDYCTECLCLEE